MKKRVTLWLTLMSKRGGNENRGLWNSIQPSFSAKWDLLVLVSPAVQHF